MSEDDCNTKPFAGWCRITCNDRETPGALTSRTSLVLHPAPGCVRRAHSSRAERDNSKGLITMRKSLKTSITLATTGALVLG
ncbi:hypothetical protein, partial [Curtobacterium sp. ME12]|uniref:hypothetical protein n=1 Tax=Curtobacterium sp. ME12 TaxID=2744253 RepID=UPI001C716B48